MSRLGFLQDLCNKYGDFKVCQALKSWKGAYWRSVLDCWQSEEGLRFLERVNNRTVLPPEIVLDIDDKNPKEKLQHIHKQLDADNFQYKSYFSGSRGYHIHLIFPELCIHGKPYRERLRQFFIKKFGSDTTIHERHMITLENAENVKTGRLKTLVRDTTWPIQ